jgi:hypothetical protein
MALTPTDILNKIGTKFSSVHANLENCYKNKTEFICGGKNFGVLDKATFDKLHGLISFLAEVSFHQTNLLQTATKRVPERLYRYGYDELGEIDVDNISYAQQQILALKSSGIELAL